MQLQFCPYFSFSILFSRVPFPLFFPFTPSYSNLLSSSPVFTVRLLHFFFCVTSLQQGNSYSPFLFMLLMLLFLIAEPIFLLLYLNPNFFFFPSLFMFDASSSNSWIHISIFISWCLFKFNDSDLGSLLLLLFWYYSGKDLDGDYHFRLIRDHLLFWPRQ